MTPEPTISVIMPVRDAAAYVGAAVESILTQEFEDFEFIIVNDASTDNTLDILEQFDDSRIRILRNEVQRGVTASLDCAAAASRARFLARMDADDIALRQRLACQLAHLQRHPEIGVLGTQAWFLDPAGRAYWKSRAYTNVYATRWQLAFGNPIIHSSAMMPRAAFDRMSGYDTRLRYAQDYDLWWRMSKVYEVANLRIPLIGRRVHPNSVSAMRVAEQEAISRRVMRTALETCLGQSVSDEDTVAITDASQRRRRVSNRAIVRIIRLIRASVRSSLARAPRSEDRLAVRATASDRLLDLVLAYGCRRPGMGMLALAEAGRCWPPAAVNRGLAGVRTFFDIHTRNPLDERR